MIYIFSIYRIRTQLVTWKLVFIKFLVRNYVLQFYL